MASISRGESPSGSVVVETIRRDRASGGKVALEGHSDHVGTCAQGEQDLGGGWQEGHDAHLRTLIDSDRRCPPLATRARRR